MQNKFLIFIKLTLIIIRYNFLNNYFIICNAQQNNRSDCESQEEISCYECNSYEDPNCAVDPAILINNKRCKICDTCVTVIAEDITYRGCSSNLLQKFTTNIDHCDKNLCNNVIFPPNRLQCYKCSGGEYCVQSPLNPGVAIRSLPCLYYKEYDECFTDVIDETDAVRGCASDGNYTFGPSVQLCSKNYSCNDQEGIAQLECIECSSELGDRGCKRPALITSPKNYTNNDNNDNCKVFINNKCSVTTLLGRQPETCFTYYKLNTVIRGCTRNSGLLQSEFKFFETCKGNLCNQKCLSQTNCYKCDSGKENENSCIMKNHSEIDENFLVSCSSEISSCYTCEHQDKNIVRGCGQPPRFEFPENCSQCQQKSSSGSNKTEACNSLKMFKCYNCTSETDVNCAFKIEKDNEKSQIYQQICPTPEDSCITYIDDVTGHTYRGCMSTISNSCNSRKYCTDCSENLCNSEVFPSNRFQCYQCSSFKFNYSSSLLNENLADNNSDDNNCNANQIEIQTNQKPCVKYQETDNGCFSYIDNDSHRIVRDCFTNTKEYEKCQSLGHKCYQCNNTDKCNYDVIVKQTNLSCVTCNYIENITCAQSVNESLFRKCSRANNTNDEYGCYARRNYHGLITRGCIIDLSSNEIEECKAKNSSSSTNTSSGYFCQLCYRDNCNMVILNKSNIIESYGGVIAIICLILSNFI